MSDTTDQQSSQGRHQARAGILWMMTATVFFTITNVSSKVLGQDVNLAQIVWGRYLFHFLILALLLNRHLPRVLKTKHLKLQLTRSILLLAGSALYFAAFILMPLTDAAALLNVTPVLVTLLAVPLLGEKVGVRRLLSVVVGLGGALLIIRPGSGLIGIVALLPLGAATTYSIYQVVTRMISGDESPTTSITYSSLAGALLMSLLVPFFWQHLELKHWALLILMGAAGATGHYAMIRAYTAAEASLIAPFNYLILIWMTVGGFLIFREVPDFWTIAGAAVIVLSGVYISQREARLRRAGETAIPPDRMAG